MEMICCPCCTKMLFIWQSVSTQSLWVLFFHILVVVNLHSIFFLLIFRGGGDTLIGCPQLGQNEPALWTGMYQMFWTSWWNWKWFCTFSKTSTYLFSSFNYVFFERKKECDYVPNIFWLDSTELSNTIILILYCSSPLLYLHILIYKCCTSYWFTMSENLWRQVCVLL